MTRRVVAVGATLLLTGTGCSGGDGASAPTTVAVITSPTLAPSTSAVTSAPTSTPSSTPVVTDPPSPVTDPPTTRPGTTQPGTTDPPTALAGDPDWLQIVQDLSDILVELQGEPDPDRVTEFCFDSENDCQNIQGEAIRQFANEGWVTLGFPGSTILSAELNFTADGLPASQAPFVIVTVDKGRADFSDARVVDVEGDVVFEIASDGDGGQSNWILARNPDDNWRVIGIQSLGEQ